MERKYLTEWKRFLNEESINCNSTFDDLKNFIQNQDQTNIEWSLKGDGVSNWTLTGYNYETSTKAFCTHNIKVKIGTKYVAGKVETFYDKNSSNLDADIIKFGYYGNYFTVTRPRKNKKYTAKPSYSSVGSGGADYK